MPKPQDVNPYSFEVNEIEYNLDGFSVVWGVWEDGSHR